MTAVFDINLALSPVWAMDPEAIAGTSARIEAGLERSLALKASAISVPDFAEALQSVNASKHPAGERLGKRNDAGILYVTGPLLKRKTWITELLGFTTYEVLRQDLQVALDDPAIKKIILYVDSPGGEANGCDELAAAIYAARSKKSVTAYVSGMACSGGYWLASAADKVIISDSAILGSIGVVLGVTDKTKRDAQDGVIHHEFVSSRSPGKRPDIKTDAGRARIQQMVDGLGDVFIAAVAKHRGVSTETVVKKFGNGGVHIGAKAVAANMANRTGQFESALRA